MKKIVAGVQMVWSGMTQVAEAMGKVLESIAPIVMPSYGEKMTEEEAKAIVAELKAKYGPRRIKLGDIDDDTEALRQDGLKLAEDTRIAERRFLGVE
jgi:hypothetical protein